MTDHIHPTAVIGKGAVLDPSCQVGPYCVLEDGVHIGAGTRLMAHVYVGRGTKIGAQNTIWPFSALGTEPQDLKYAGEETHAEIGDHNTIREHVTVHRGTSHGGGLTTVGSHNLLMVGSHVAHDCHVGSHTILSHNCSLAGHVTVGDYASVGAYSAVHQFCRVGDHAFIGGFSVVTQDALPFVKTVGRRDTTIFGINKIGLERKGFSKETLTQLNRAYRILFNKGFRLTEAVAQVKEAFSDSREVSFLIDFIEASERGVVR